MKYLDIDIGGRPGADCGGFCEYGYFKRVKNPQAPGCRYCGTSHVGCTYCSTILQEGSFGFRPFFAVAVNAALRYLSRDRIVKGIRITGGGDPSCYPKLRELIGLFGTVGIPSSIGYTSGKGFTDTATGRFLVRNGLSEIGFSIFSANPDLRRTYMHDPGPDPADSPNICGSPGSRHRCNRRYLFFCRVKPGDFSGYAPQVTEYVRKTWPDTVSIRPASQCDK